MPEIGGSQPHTQIHAAAMQAKFEQGLALHQLGRLAEAERIYREVLQQLPNHFGALHMLGVIAFQTRHTERAVELIGKAIALKPDNAEAYSNRGNALRDLKRPADALASYDRAIALKPDLAEAYSNRGIALQDLKRPVDALACYDRAIALKPDYAEAHYNRALALVNLKRPEEALASYDRAIVLKPDYAEAYSNRGLALENLKRSDEALASYDRAIALKRDYAEAYSNRGNALRDLKRPAEALASYDRAIALEPGLAEAYYNRGNVLRDLKHRDKAFSAYGKALALNPDLIGAEGARLRAKMLVCDWSNFSDECAHLISSVWDGKVNTTPFALLAIPSTAADQLQCAKLWVAAKCACFDEPKWLGERYDHNRIRVGYVSSDFSQHATSWLMAGLFECHDKSRIDITAISFGGNDNSELRQRLEQSFEHFIDAKTYSDEQIANLVRSLQIDILVDLKGFTNDSRPRIFAQRAAPIQVNYLGFPGTMGAPYMDYIIADQIVIPENHKSVYSEKVIYLPNSYQVNDDKRSIAAKMFTRTELGLPATGFVFCCFNNNYKITPDIFDCWMRILGQVEGSILWLLEYNPSATRNLKKEAVARGVDAERLVFAKQMLLPEHLARHRLADLFLDTMYCNAHTTASDALWAGLPVLTYLGTTFAGRVAASLLNAVCVPELITTRPEAYEQMAIDLATHPEQLTVIKRKLANNRLTTPLFDTKLFTKHIEAAYIAMYERHQAGLAPDHIVIAN